MPIQKTSLSLNNLEKFFKYFLSFALVFVHFINSAQNVDSLKAILKTAKNDTLKLNALVEISEFCELEEIQNYSNAAVILADKLLQQNATTGMSRERIILKKIRAVFNVGYFYLHTGEPDKAIAYNEKCLKLAFEINDKVQISGAFLFFGNVYISQNKYDEAAENYKKAIKYARESQNKVTEGSALNGLGSVYNYKGDNVLALDYYNRSLKIAEEINDEGSIAQSLNNMAVIYAFQSDVPKALECYERCLRINEARDNLSETASTLNNIGLLYINQKDLIKPLEYFKKALKLFEQVNDKAGIASINNSLGNLYLEMKKYDEALAYFINGAKLQAEVGNKFGISSGYINIAVIYNLQKKLPLAMEYCNKALIINREIGNKRGIASTLEELASAYLAMALLPENAGTKQKNLKLALSYADSSLIISKELGFPMNIRNAEDVLATAYSEQKNYAAAFEHYKQFILYSDSLNNENTRKASIKTQLKYEFEKKEAVIKEQQEKERIIAEEKNRFQKIIIASVLAGLLLVIVFAFFIFRSLKVTKHQKHIIEEKQKEILDSIHYAKRIQTSLLPTEKYIAKHLNEDNS